MSFEIPVHSGWVAAVSICYRHYLMLFASALGKTDASCLVLGGIARVVPPRVARRQLMTRRVGRHWVSCQGCCYMVPSGLLGPKKTMTQRISAMRYPPLCWHHDEPT